MLFHEESIVKWRERKGNVGKNLYTIHEVCAIIKITKNYNSKR